MADIFLRAVSCSPPFQGGRCPLPFTPRPPSPPPVVVMFIKMLLFFIVKKCHLKWVYPGGKIKIKGLILQFRKFKSGWDFCFD